MLLPSPGCSLSQEFCESQGYILISKDQYWPLLLWGKKVGSLFSLPRKCFLQLLPQLLQHSIARSPAVQHNPWCRGGWGLHGFRSFSRWWDLPVAESNTPESWHPQASASKLVKPGFLQAFICIQMKRPKYSGILFSQGNECSFPRKGWEWWKDCRTNAGGTLESKLEREWECKWNFPLLRPKMLRLPPIPLWGSSERFNR